MLHFEIFFGKSLIWINHTFEASVMCLLDHKINRTCFEKMQRKIMVGIQRKYIFSIPFFAQQKFIQIFWGKCFRKCTLIRLHLKSSNSQRYHNKMRCFLNFDINFKSWRMPYFNSHPKQCEEATKGYIAIVCQSAYITTFYP